MANIPVAPKKGRYGLQYRGVECTNCGHPLDISDRFCPNCSQANSTKKLSIKDFVDEFFASLISYDSKLLKTLSALLWRPGKITKDYIAGKRISYTNPFRFLLSLAILYFLLLNISTDFGKLDEFGADGSGNWFKKHYTFSFGADNDMMGKEDTKNVLNTLDSLKIYENLAKSDSILLSNPKNHFNDLESKWFLGRVFVKREFFSAAFRFDKIDVFEDIIEKYQMEASRENRLGYDMATSLRRFQQTPGSFVRSIVSKLPFAIFLFLPVFTIFVWLVYIRKKYTYTDHLIFSFHNQSLLFILLVISFIVSSVFNIFTGWIFIFAFAIYLFLAMKRFYDQGIFKTLVKYLFLNAVFFILAVFTMVILFIGGIFTY